MIAVQTYRWGLEEFEGEYVRPNKGRTLIVGSQVYVGKEDRRARYPEVLGVDMSPGPGVDRVLDLEQPLPDDIGLFAHIECMSVLEHSARPWLLAANLERLLPPGGSIFVAVPFVWRVHGYPDDYWRFTHSGVRVLFPNIKWSVELYAHKECSKANQIPVTKIGELPYFGRTEACSFGHRQ